MRTVTIFELADLPNGTLFSPNDDEYMLVSYDRIYRKDATNTDSEGVRVVEFTVLSYVFPSVVDKRWLATPHSEQTINHLEKLTVQWMESGESSPIRFDVGKFSALRHTRVERYAVWEEEDVKELRRAIDRALLVFQPDLQSPQ